jgi:hypothetical protein
MKKKMLDGSAERRVTSMEQLSVVTSKARFYRTGTFQPRRMIMW